MAKQAGILYVTSVPKTISSSSLNKWYDEEHVNDTLATNIFTSGYRFQEVTQSTFMKSKNPPSKDEFLGFYPTKDLSLLNSKEYKSIPISSKILGEGNSEKKCFDVIDFGIRHYELIDEYEGERSKLHKSPGKLLLAGAMTPSPSLEEEFHQWYRDEHYQALAACKHYIRTKRYRLVKTVLPRGEEPPKFLSVHEFDCEPQELDVVGLGKSVKTEWSRKIMGSAVKGESKVWKRIGAWDEVKAKM